MRKKATNTAERAGLPTGRKMAETVHILACAVWLAALVGVGMAAAVLFPMMRDADPIIPAMHAYEGDHWRLLAGLVAGRLFMVGDVLQLLCGMVALVTLAVVLGVYGRTLPLIWSAVRGFAMMAALSVLAFHLFILSPPMWSDLNTYRDAAAVGENERAAEAQASFNERHPMAVRSLGLTTLSVVVLMGAGVWSIGSSGGGTLMGGASAGRGGSGLEPPALLTGRGRR